MKLFFFNCSWGGICSSGEQYNTHSNRDELGESHPYITFYWKLEELWTIFWFYFYYLTPIRRSTPECFLPCFNSCLPGWSGNHCSFWTISKHERTLMDCLILDSHLNSKWKLFTSFQFLGLVFWFISKFDCVFWFCFCFNPLLFHSWFALVVLVGQFVSWLLPLSSVDSCRLSGRDLILFLSLF